jgi:outer membrane lipoprotein-sorting protein
MRSARLLGALIGSLLLPRALLAAKPQQREPAEVLAKMSVAAGQLVAMSGELDVRYFVRGTHHADHRAKFWFAKPFRVKVVQLPHAGEPAMELTYADQRAWLYQPERKQVVEFDLTGGGPTDLLPRVFSLFAIPGFVQGALLSDVESHFATTVEPVGKDAWVLTLVAHAHSLFRVALGIDRVVADVDVKSMMPRRLEIHDEGPNGPRLLCRVGLSKLKFNPKLNTAIFKFEAPPDVRRVPSTEILREWAGEAVSRASQQGLDVLNSLQERILKLRDKPWDF